MQDALWALKSYEIIESTHTLNYNGLILLDNCKKEILGIKQPIFTNPFLHLGLKNQVQLFGSGPVKTLSEQ